MMHYNNAVVTILAIPSKKACREYNHNRQGNVSFSQVLLPFESEYGIGYKLPSGTRYRLELSIDGVEVTKDLILTGSGHLERFLDSNKRFKFVAADHPDVMDPSSPDNGGIEVKLFEELPPSIEPAIWKPYDPWERTPKWPSDPWITYSSTATPDNYTYTSHSQEVCRGIHPQGLTCSTASESRSVNCVFTPASASVTGEIGATVEGSKSSQTFGTTTWRGDNPLSNPLIFKFKLLGKTTAEEPKLKRAIECPICHAFSKESAKFCCDCGAKLK